MSASALLTLSEVRRFTGDYLIDAAQHWSGSAQRWTDSYDDLMRDVVQPIGTEWMGEAAEAAAVQVGTDRRQVAGAADELSAAAATARRAADNLQAARARLLDTVRAAEMAGFTVGEDFSLTSRDSTMWARALADLEEQAGKLGTAIRADVLGLVKADERAAAEIARAATGLRSLNFGDDEKAKSERAAIQAVDFHGVPLPEKPPHPPPIPPPEGWSSDPLMRAAQKIAYGHAYDKHQADFRDLTREQLAQVIYQKMQRSMTDPSGLTLSLTEGDRAPMIYDPEDRLMIIRDTRPNASGGGTVFKPPDHDYVNRKSDSYVSIFTPDQLADGSAISTPADELIQSDLASPAPAPPLVSQTPSGDGGDDSGNDAPATGSAKGWGTYVPPKDLAKTDGALGILGRIILGQARPNPHDPDSWA